MNELEESKYLDIVKEILLYAENCEEEIITKKNFNKIISFNLENHIIPLFSFSYTPYKNIFTEMVQCLKDSEKHIKTVELFISQKEKFWNILRQNLKEFKLNDMIFEDNLKNFFKIYKKHEKLNISVSITHIDIYVLPRLISEYAILIYLIGDIYNLNVSELKIKIHGVFVYKYNLKDLKKITNSQIFPFPNIIKKRCFTNLEELKESNFEIYGYCYKQTK